MKAIGITCGIGSLLVGARQAGFDVVGNIEWREAYHVQDAQGRNTFTENFPGATLHENIDHMTMDEIERFMNPTLALSHPECGRYSVLGGSLRDREERLQDPGDIPLAIDLISRLKPKFFALDDLPKSFGAFPMSEYHRRLPGYDLYPEWVSNWGYGNIQKNRNRMFMLGALRDFKWAFVPGEEPHSTTMRDLIEDLGEPRMGSNYLNHDPHDNTQLCYRGLHLYRHGNRPTWNDMIEYFKGKKPGDALEYVRADGSIVRRIGFMKDRWADGPGYTITGGNPILHGVRCDPYTIRERARIQGFPDDFVFYGTELNERGEWHHYELTMVKQTGKAMPVQFARYVSRQVAAHVRGEAFEASGRRVLKPNEYVDRAKQWYCQEVGYSDQERACAACWMKDFCGIRVRKYGMAPVSRSASQPTTPGPRPRPRPRPRPTPPPLPPDPVPPVTEPPRPAAVTTSLQQPIRKIRTRIMTFGGPDGGR